MSTKLCHCGSCEQAIERAIGVADKMLRDGECAMYLMAVGAALRGIGLNIAASQIGGVLSDEGMPDVIGKLLAREGAANSCTNVDKLIKDTFMARDKHYADLVNDSIAAANKKYEEERNLPKGD